MIEKYPRRTKTEEKQHRGNKQMNNECTLNY